MNLKNGKWTIAEQIESQRQQQAWIRFESEVRQEAKSRGASRMEADELAMQARGVFKIINNQPCAFGADGETMLRGEDGELLSVKEWVAGLTVTT